MKVITPAGLLATVALVAGGALWAVSPSLAQPVPCTTAACSEEGPGYQPPESNDKAVAAEEGPGYTAPEPVDSSEEDTGKAPDTDTDTDTDDSEPQG